LYFNDLGFDKVTLITVAQDGQKQAAIFAESKLSKMIP
jgi:hypothetical protein